MYIPVACNPRNHCAIFGGRRHNLVLAVGNAQAAAEIDMSDYVAGRAQFLHQFADFAKGGFERLQIA